MTLAEMQLAAAALAILREDPGDELALETLERLSNGHIAGGRRDTA